MQLSQSSVRKTISVHMPTLGFNRFPTICSPLLQPIIICHFPSLHPIKQNLKCFSLFAVIHVLLTAYWLAKLHSFATSTRMLAVLNNSSCVEVSIP